MNTKKQLKISIIVSMIGIICLVIGVSYAIFNSTLFSNKRQVIKSGSVVLTLTETTSGIELNNLSEMSDTEGLNQSSYYEFTVANTGNNRIYYTLKLIDDTVANTTYGGTILNSNYVKVGLEKNGINQGALNLGTANRIINEGVINKNTTDSYKLRLWLDFTGLTAEQKAVLLLQTAYFKVKIESTQILDNTKPICNFVTEPSNITVKANDILTYVLECTDESSITDGIILTSDFASSSSLSVTNVEMTSITNGFRYNLTVTGGSTDNDSAKISLKANSIMDKYENKNNTIASSGIEVRNNLDTSRANLPVLATGMIPVYYDASSATWKKADNNNASSAYQWYSYESSGSKKGMWANAVTVTSTNRATYQSAALGTTIPMSDINTMWVWIPRFKVNTIDFSQIRGIESTCTWDSTVKCYNTPGAIDITFVNKNVTAHDAFFFDENNNSLSDEGEEKSGFWYGKFENSATSIPSSASNTNHTIIIKPDVQSWRYSNISTYFNSSRIMENSGNAYGFDNTIDITLDTHMSKNNEWGAVTYLTQSIYGRCTSETSCTEVVNNNSSSFYTGRSSGSLTSTTTSSSGTYSYNSTTYGPLASTTGTIYGIYDMSGGAVDYVMGNFNRYIGYNSSYNSGFNGPYGEGGSLTTGVAFPDTKYVNIYVDSANIYYGHALLETKGWYNDYGVYFLPSYPWLKRGGGYSDNKNGGIFDYDTYYGAASASGSAYVNATSRTSITIN